jgi:hypothetical protein
MLLAALKLADWLSGFAILVIAVATAVAARHAWRSSSFQRLVPGAVVSVIGVLLLIAFYRWGFSEGTCEGRGDLVCLTNENQGVLTLLALFIAALAIWVEVLSRYGEERKQAKKRKDRANEVVAAAIVECHHNLIHAALCYEDDEMELVPWGISIQSVTALGGPEIRADVDQGLLDRLDPLRRTYETVQECRVNVQNARSDEERTEAERYLLEEPEPFQAFVMQNMGFLVDAWLAYATVDSCRQALQRPGLQDIPRLIGSAARAGARYNCFRTSDEEAQEEAPTIRTREIPVLCWIDDKPIGVKTFALKPRFADAAKSHRH